MIPITVVDNFYHDPFAIREYATSLDYNREDESPWPGFRSDYLDVISPKLYDQLKSKLTNLFFENVKYVEFDLQASFHVTPASFGSGWAHTDIGKSFAGVVYLTPNAPLDSGTTIFNNPTLEIKRSIDARYDEVNTYEKHITSAKHMSFKIAESGIGNSKPYDIIREEHNSVFTESCKVSNVFNRLAIYPANLYHAESKFFGNSPNDSRLTLVFFGIIKTSRLFPLDRLWSVPQ